MAAGDIKPSWAASSNLTVTNLHSLPASAAWLAGWESAVIDATALDDVVISGTLVTASANRQAGTIFVYIVPMLDDTTYFDVFDGTESTETISTSGIRDSIGKLAAAIAVGSTNAEVADFWFSVASKCGGVCPPKFVIFITGNAATSTNAQLAAAGNQVTVKGLIFNVAQS